MTSPAGHPFSFDPAERARYWAANARRCLDSARRMRLRGLPRVARSDLACAAFARSRLAYELSWARIEARVARLASHAS